MTVGQRAGSLSPGARVRVRVRVGSLLRKFAGRKVWSLAGFLYIYFYMRTAIEVFRYSLGARNFPRSTRGIHVQSRGFLLGVDTGYDSYEFALTGSD